ncbi:Hyoscyamine 6-dioxygenase [Glycine soja]|uniref:Hyoscyamine 6-dioxygenase n=2 Tax=Glycine soja TaxID=3848 RepID=A0A445JJU3_GLYSO|nr:Hyoscyamine 6-dioxygenase [Glycine soja]
MTGKHMCFYHTRKSGVQIKMDRSGDHPCHSCCFNIVDRKLVSSWYNLDSLVTSSCVQPPERRPGNAILASGKLVPVIDLGGHDRAVTIKNILNSSQDYVFFQVINHGVSKDLVDSTQNIFKEFHAMPADVKIHESPKDPNGSCKIYTSSARTTKDVVEYWKDTLSHPCQPSGEFKDYWPEKPVGYREVVGKYTQELRKLALQILELICEGFDLNPEYFCGGLGENPVVLSHFYPPCLEPSLTLGTFMHKDSILITILFQEVGINALQVFKDGNGLVLSQFTMPLW